MWFLPNISTVFKQGCCGRPPQEASSPLEQRVFGSAAERLSASVRRSMRRWDCLYCRPVLPPVLPACKELSVCIAGVRRLLVCTAL